MCESLCCSRISFLMCESLRCVFVAVDFAQTCISFDIQGRDQYVKRVNALYFDCRPTVMRPLSWYAERHLVAGFANTLETRPECNCDFVTVGNQVFIKARRLIQAGEEIYVYYTF